MNSKPLGAIGAIWRAFFGADVSHFPRFIGSDNKALQIDSDDMIRRIADEIGSPKPLDVSQMENLIKRGRESLDEVKALTEYEDNKATRNLTVITFLSALAGVLFSRFADLYPLRDSLTNLTSSTLEAGLIVLVYFLFFAFVMCAISGALIIFHATRIRFKYPELKPERYDDEQRSTKSFLFFKEIIQVTPEAWARSFLEDRSENGSLARYWKDISASYLQNYIIESYLIAAKVADKLRYLMPAQTIFSLSIRILMLWFLFTSLAMITIPVQSNEAGPLHILVPINLKEKIQ